MAPTPTSPGDAPSTDAPPAPAPSPGTSGFFGWLRSLGIPRSTGWIGGVAAGLAARLGIDPVIVRGVLVVFALFGAPAFLLYGAAWLLLPDTTGRIHLERLLAGVWDRALVGIALFLLVGLFPLAFGVPSAFIGFWDVWDGGGWGPWFNPFGFNVLPVIWAVVLIGGIVALVVWLVNRSRDTERETPPEAAFARYEAAAQAERATPTTGAQSAAGAASAPGAASSNASAAAPATTSAAATTTAGTTSSSPHPTTGRAGTAGATAATTATSAGAGTAPSSASPAAGPAGPASGAAGGSADEYAQWRQRQEEWRVEHEAWRRSQAEANRAARQQLAAQNAARAAEFQAQAQRERDLRRATRPRTSFAFVVAALGAAMLAGAIASLLALPTEAADVAVAIGLAAATVVTALAMVLAGALRRRSGFLAFVTIVLFLATLGTAALPGAPRFVIGTTSGPVSATTLLVPAGSVQLSVDDRLSAADSPVRAEVLQGAGRVDLELRDGARAEIRVECGSCFVARDRVDGNGDVTAVEGAQLTGGQAEWSWDETVGAGLTPGETDAIITIRAGATDVQITEYTDED